MTEAPRLEDLHWINQNEPGELVPPGTITRHADIGPNLLTIFQWDDGKYDIDNASISIWKGIDALTAQCVLIELHNEGKLYPVGNET